MLFNFYDILPKFWMKINHNEIFGSWVTNLHNHRSLSIFSSSKEHAATASRSKKLQIGYTEIKLNERGTKKSTLFIGERKQGK